jgi:hypothetical protein
LKIFIFKLKCLGHNDYPIQILEEWIGIDEPIFVLARLKRENPNLNSFKRT